MDSASLKQVFNLRGANIRKRFRRKEFRSRIDILDAPEETCTGQDVAEECRVGLQGTKGDPTFVAIPHSAHDAVHVFYPFASFVSPLSTSHQHVHARQNARSRSSSCLTLLRIAQFLEDFKGRLDKPFAGTEEVEQVDPVGPAFQNCFAASR